MSGDAPTTVESPRAPREPAPLRCPRCGAYVAPEQDWCLECGAPARTRLAPTPNWRLPIAITVTVILAALVVLAIAFVSLTGDDGTVPAATTTTPPAQPAESAPTQPVPAPPAATTTTPSPVPGPASTTITPAPSGGTTAPATTPAPLPGATTPTTPGR